MVRQRPEQAAAKSKNDQSMAGAHARSGAGDRCRLSRRMLGGRVRTGATEDNSVIGVETNPFAAAWTLIREGLRQDCGARTFDSWLRPIELINFDEADSTIQLGL